MAYKVYNIKVIKPNKVKSLLPVKDKDLATLMTCTPYMINSHRMLVTGYRVPYTKKIAREVEGASLMNNLIQAAVMLGCVMAIISVFYILYRIFFVPLLTNHFQCCILFPSLSKFWMKGVLYEYIQH